MKALVFGLLAIAVAAVTLSQAPAGGIKKSDSVLKMIANLEKTPAGKTVAVLKIDIDKGWHLYANPVGVEDLDANQVVVTVAGAPTAVIEYPTGKVVEEESLGKFKIYEGSIVIRATFDRPATEKGPVELNVRVAACSDKKCLKPATVKVTAP